MGGDIHRAAGLEVLRQHFQSIVETMSYVIERTAITAFIKENADFTTGLATPDGEFFAYPANLGVTTFLGLSLKAAIDYVGEFEPGDVIITNDPYTTGGIATHLPDIHVFKPLFAGGRLAAFAWAFIHSSDIGGAVPASISPAFTELFQEGLRIPPMKLYRGGRPDPVLPAIIRANCRVPDDTWGDINAMVAALNTAEARFQELVDRFGPGAVCQAAADLLDAAEQRARRVIAAIPDGTYTFSDFLDSDVVSDVPVRIKVTMTVDGDRIHLDYTGTDPQLAAALNLPAFGERHPFLATTLLYHILTEDPDIPLPAAGAGQAAIVVLAAHDRRKGLTRVSVLEPISGGGGGLPGQDGCDANDVSSAFLRNAPVESIERHLPVLVERYDLVPDSAGAGEHRGGFGVQIHFRVLEDDSVVTCRGLERFRFRPWGVYGGLPGSPGRAVLNPGTEGERDLGKITAARFRAGDVVAIIGAGGGGYGDPLRRDPQRVLADWRAGLLSEEAARRDYGVVIRDGAVDVEATAALRAARRSMREAPEPFNFCAEREALERQWPPAVLDAVNRWLYRQPVNKRPLLRSALFEMGAAREVVTEDDLAGFIAELVGLYGAEA